MKTGYNVEELLTHIKNSKTGNAPPTTKLSPPEKKTMLAEILFGKKYH